MQQLRSFEAFLLVLGILILTGAGICGLIVPGSPVSGGFAIAGGLCFVAAAIMYNKPATKKSTTAAPAKASEAEGASPPKTDITSEPK
jgi:hypothetical protein